MEEQKMFGLVGLLPQGTGFQKRIMYLTDYLIDNLQKLKIDILTPVEQKKYRSGIVTFIPRKKKQAEIVDQLEKRSKVVVSARGKGIRISPHFYNIEQDIVTLILGLRRILRSERYIVIIC